MLVGFFDWRINVWVVIVYMSTWLRYYAVNWNIHTRPHAFPAAYGVSFKDQFTLRLYLL